MYVARYVCCMQQWVWQKGLVRKSIQTMSRAVKGESKQPVSLNGLLTCLQGWIFLNVTIIWHTPDLTTIVSHKKRNPDSQHRKGLRDWAHIQSRKSLAPGPCFFCIFDNTGNQLGQSKSYTITIITAHVPVLHIWASPCPWSQVFWNSGSQTFMLKFKTLSARDRQWRVFRERNI